jgi:hypothetical protein
MSSSQNVDMNSRVVELEARLKEAEDELRALKDKSSCGQPFIPSSSSLSVPHVVSHKGYLYRWLVCTLIHHLSMTQLKILKKLVLLFTIIPC